MSPQENTRLSISSLESFWDKVVKRELWSLFYAKNTSLDFSFSTVSNQFQLALSVSSTPSCDHHNSVFFRRQFLVQQSVFSFPSIFQF